MIMLTIMIMRTASAWADSTPWSWFVWRSPRYRIIILLIVLLTVICVLMIVFILIVIMNIMII